MIKRIKELLKNSLALLFGLVIAFIIAEIVLRIYNPFPATVRGDKILLRANTKIIYSKPNADGQMKEHVVTTNKHGFRGANPPENLSEHLSIITVGGSTTQCLYSSDSTTWTAYLEKELKPSFPGLWINNAGLAGHTTFGHRILMQDYIVKLKPDFVIFLFGINDVGVMNDTSGFSLYARNDENRFLKWVKTTLYKSEVIGICVNLLRYMKANRQALKYDYNFNIKTAPHFTLSEERAGEIYKENTAGLPGYYKRVSDIADICTANGIVPVFITQPSLYADTLDAMSGVNLATVKVGNRNGSLSYRLLRAYNNEMKRVASERNILLIDVAAQLPHDSRYYYDFIHYTDAGNEKIAAIISSQLKQRLKNEESAVHK